MTRATVSGHVNPLHVGHVRMVRDAREPAAETCDRLGIEIVFGVGGDDKADAGSRIIGETGL